MWQLWPEIRQLTVMAPKVRHKDEEAEAVTGQGRREDVHPVGKAGGCSGRTGSRRGNTPTKEKKKHSKEASLTFQRLWVSYLNVHRTHQMSPLGL